MHAQIFRLPFGWSCYYFSPTRIRRWHWKKTGYRRKRNGHGLRLVCFGVSLFWIVPAGGRFFILFSDSPCFIPRQAQSMGMGLECRKAYRGVIGLSSFGRFLHSSKEHYTHSDREAFFCIARGVLFFCWSSLLHSSFVGNWKV